MTSISTILLFETICLFFCRSSLEQSCGASYVGSICCTQVDVTDLVNGHSSYLKKAGDIVQALDIDSFYPTHNCKLQ